MANHVRMWITVSGSKDAKAAFGQIAQELEQTRRQFEFGDTQVIAKVLFGGKELLIDDDLLGGGASWVFVDEADKNQISLTAGWRPAFGVGEEILRRVSQHDKKAQVHLTFVDEAPNFAGGSVYALVDGEIWRTDDWQEFEASEVLFDSEYEELDPDEAEHYLSWDDVHENMEGCLQVALQYLRDRKQQDFSKEY